MVSSFRGTESWRKGSPLTRRAFSSFGVGELMIGARCHLACKVGQMALRLLTGLAVVCRRTSCDGLPDGCQMAGGVSPMASHLPDRGRDGLLGTSNRGEGAG